MTAEPIDRRTIEVAAGATAVSSRGLPDLVHLAQVELAANADAYRRWYECVHETEDRCTFLVESGHWARIADRLRLDAHEADALRRTHEEQLRRIGRRTGREREFEVALEIREVVVVATS